LFYAEDNFGVCLEVKITVLVSPGSKHKSVKKILGLHKFLLKSPAVDGKANLELIVTLAEILKVPKSFILIYSGFSSKTKRLIINSELTQKQVELLIDQFVDSNINSR
jgi:uncharacterized protein YggU (UPF0235/DUF167 family)